MNAADVPLWTAGDAAKAVGAQTGGDWQATGVSIDSRTAAPGDLFVAIRGPKFDGHDYVAEALAAGAAAAVVDHRPDGVADDAPLLRVADTTRALADLGAAARDRTRARVIAVTGSVGKTGTKEALGQVLAEQGPTAASLGNLNNHWGVPLSLARLPAGAAYGVFEIGMNHPGELAPLARMARPHVGVVTTVEAVHRAHFESVEAIADAKAEMFQGMDGESTAVLNRDNAQFDRLSRAAEAAGVGTIIGFGADDKAHVRVLEADTDEDGADVTAQVMGDEIAYRIGVPGRHWIDNSLAVLAAAAAAGADVAQAAAALAGIGGLKGRGRRYRVEIEGGALTVIDESYNASPVSMNAAFEVLGRIRPTGGGRRIAVLGDMLELGEESASLHAGLVEGLIKNKINLVFTAGPDMAALWAVLPKSMQGGQAASAAEIEPVLTASIRAGDVVMVKGSAGSDTGPIVDALLARGRPAGTGADASRHAVNG